MNTPSSEALPSSQNTRSVSPPPQYSSQEPYRNPRPNNRSLARTRQISVSTGDNIRYGATSNAMLGEGTNCWSDEFTASAVLSLLHREPLSPLPCPVTYNPISARNTSLLTCTVCFETFRDDFFPDAPIAAGCDHASMPGTHICLGCLRRSLDVQLSSSDTNQLECPLCHEQLSDEEVHRWASRRTFQAYDRRRTWQVLEEDAEFIMCIRSDCGYGQLHAGGLEDPIVVCGSCGTRTCFIHRQTPWHEGLTCAQYEDMINPRVSNDSIEAYPENTPDVSSESHEWTHVCEEDSHSELMRIRTIEELTWPCPACSVPTERSGKHIRCGVCRHEWCWDCGISWHRGHRDTECILSPQ